MNRRIVLKIFSTYFACKIIYDAPVSLCLLRVGWREHRILDGSWTHACAALRGSSGSYGLLICSIFNLVSLIKKNSDIWEEVPFSGVQVRCAGQSGHGSQFLPNTAGEKLSKVINSFLTFREEQHQLLKNNPDLALGDVTTLNLTTLKVRNFVSAILNIFCSDVACSCRFWNTVTYFLIVEKCVMVFGNV